MSLSGQLRKLEEQGIDLVGILGGDQKISPQQLAEILRRLPRGAEDHLYSELLYQITLQRFTEEEARRLWHLISRHKQWLNRALGRNVGFRVALLDYLSNKQSILKGVRIVGREAFEVLLSQVLRTINAPATQAAGVVASGIQQILNVVQAYVDKLEEAGGASAEAAA